MSLGPLCPNTVEAGDRSAGPPGALLGKVRLPVFEDALCHSVSRAATTEEPSESYLVIWRVSW